MTAPIELRQYIKKYSLDDARDGVTPVKLPTGPLVNGTRPFDLFHPQPILQFRYKEKVHLNGAPTTQWSEWISIDFVKEGDPEA